MRNVFFLFAQEQSALSVLLNYERDAVFFSTANVSHLLDVQATGRLMPLERPSKKAKLKTGPHHSLRVPDLFSVARCTTLLFHKAEGKQNAWTHTVQWSSHTLLFLDASVWFLLRSMCDPDPWAWLLFLKSPVVLWVAIRTQGESAWNGGNTSYLMKDHGRLKCFGKCKPKCLVNVAWLLVFGDNTTQADGCLTHASHIRLVVPSRNINSCSCTT